MPVIQASCTRPVFWTRDKTEHAFAGDGARHLLRREHFTLRRRPVHAARLIAPLGERAEADVLLLVERLGTPALVQSGALRRGSQSERGVQVVLVEHPDPASVARALAALLGAGVVVEHQRDGMRDRLEFVEAPS